MRRILVIGCGGSGKTHLARRLAERTGLPLVHLDQLYWQADWTPTPPDVWQALVQAVTERDAWILDGNYGGTLELRIAASDTVVFLDAPRRVCLWRLVRRRWRYRGAVRPEMTERCPERLTWEFLSWVWTYPHRRRDGILKRLRALAPGTRVEVLRSRRAVEQFVAAIPRAAA